MADEPDLPCRLLVERASDHLDGVVGADERRRIEAHLAECEGCEVYVDQLRRTVALVARIDDDAQAPDPRVVAGLLHGWNGGRAEGAG